MTKNLEIDEVRKKLEALETTGDRPFTPVKMSYQTANKIGSKETNLTMEMLYSQEEIIPDVLNSAKSVLPLSGYRIQQETPSKEDKFFQKGKDAYISMGSQFMKIILGNFINSDTNEIFPNVFTKEMLEPLGLHTKDKLSGADLDKIYNEIYLFYFFFLDK